MSNTFESSRPEHKLMEMTRPEAHAHLDQKFDKGMRSPWLSKLPSGAGLESPSTSDQGGSGFNDHGYTGG